MEEDATIWARWSSAEFDTGASRQACNNSYDKKYEEHLVANHRRDAPDHITHDDFVRLVEPSFKNIGDEENLLAVLARAHVILLTDFRVYFREATENRKTVPFWKYPDPQNPDVFGEDCKADFARYMKDKTAFFKPRDMQKKLDWEHQYLNRLFHSQPVPNLYTVWRNNVWGQPNVPRTRSEPFPALPDAPPSPLSRPQGSGQRASVDNAEETADNKSPSAENPFTSDEEDFLGLGGDMDAPEEEAPAPATPPPLAPVKVEPGVFKRALTIKQGDPGSSGNPYDLSTPSPAAKRTKVDDVELTPLDAELEALFSQGHAIEEEAAAQSETEDK